MPHMCTNNSNHWNDAEHHHTEVGGDVIDGVAGVVDVCVGTGTDNADDTNNEDALVVVGDVVSNDDDNNNNETTTTTTAAAVRASAFSAAHHVQTEMLRHSNVVDTKRINDIVRLECEEVMLGDLLGSGTFCHITEVSSIEFKESNHHNNKNTTTAIIKYSNYHQHNSTMHGDGSDGTTTTWGDDMVSPTTMQRRRKVLCDGAWKGKYAIKFLRGDLDPDKFRDGAAELVVEMLFLTSLDHRNIIKLHGVSNEGLRGFENGTGYFILIDRLHNTLEKQMILWREFKGHHHQHNNRSNSSIILRQDEPHPPSNASQLFLLLERLTVAADISSAIAYLHSKKILYRGIDPTNMAFNHKGKIVLFDFGLSLELEDTKLTSDGINYELNGNKGSLHYMAPEVAMCQPYGMRADVYGMAVLLWQLCTLAPSPFPNLTNRIEYLERIVQNKERPTIETAWSDTLQHLIQSSWADEPSLRPPMKQFHRNLKHEILDIQTCLKHQAMRPHYQQSKNVSGDGATIVEQNPLLVSALPPVPLTSPGLKHQAMRRRHQSKSVIDDGVIVAQNPLLVSALPPMPLTSPGLKNQAMRRRHHQSKSVIGTDGAIVAQNPLLLVSPLSPTQPPSSPGLKHQAMRRRSHHQSKSAIGADGAIIVAQNPLLLVSPLSPTQPPTSPGYSNWPQPSPISSNRPLRVPSATRTPKEKRVSRGSSSEGAVAIASAVVEHQHGNRRITVTPTNVNTNHDIESATLAMLREANKIVELSHPASPVVGPDAAHLQQQDEMLVRYKRRLVDAAFRRIETQPDTLTSWSQHQSQSIVPSSPDQSHIITIKGQRIQRRELLQNTSISSSSHHHVTHKSVVETDNMNTNRNTIVHSGEVQKNPTLATSALLAVRKGDTHLASPSKGGRQGGESRFQFFLSNMNKKRSSDTTTKKTLFLSSHRRSPSDGPATELLHSSWSGTTERSALFSRQPNRSKTMRTISWKDQVI